MALKFLHRLDYVEGMPSPMYFSNTPYVVADLLGSTVTYTVPDDPVYLRRIEHVFRTVTDDGYVPGVSDSYVMLEGGTVTADLPSLALGTNNFSLAFWSIVGPPSDLYQFDDPSPNEEVIFTFLDGLGTIGCSKYEVLVQQHPDTGSGYYGSAWLIGRVTNMQTGATSTTTTPIESNGKWYRPDHIAITRVGTTVWFGFNGTAQSRTTLQRSSSNACRMVLRGRMAFDPDYHLMGLVYPVQTYFDDLYLETGSYVAAWASTTPYDVPLEPTPYTGSGYPTTAIIPTTFLGQPTAKINRIGVTGKTTTTNFGTPKSPHSLAPWVKSVFLGAPTAKRNTVGTAASVVNTVAFGAPARKLNIVGVATSIFSTQIPTPARPLRTTGFVGTQIGTPYCAYDKLGTAPSVTTQTLFGTPYGKATHTAASINSTVVGAPNKAVPYIALLVCRTYGIRARFVGKPTRYKPHEATPAHTVSLFGSPKGITNQYRAQAGSVAARVNMGSPTMRGSIVGRCASINSTWFGTAFAKYNQKGTPTWTDQATLGHPRSPDLTMYDSALFLTTPTSKNIVIHTESP